MTDAKKPTGYRGIGRPSKLSDRQWLDVRDCLANGVLVSDVSRRFGVSKGAISKRFPRSEILKYLCDQAVREEVARTQDDQSKRSQAGNETAAGISKLAATSRRPFVRGEATHSGPRAAGVVEAAFPGGGGVFGGGSAGAWRHRVAIEATTEEDEAILQDYAAVAFGASIADARGFMRALDRLL